MFRDISTNMYIEICGKFSRNSGCNLCHLLNKCKGRPNFFVNRATLNVYRIWN